VRCDEAIYWAAQARTHMLFMEGRIPSYSEAARVAREAKGLWLLSMVKLIETPACNFGCVRLKTKLLTEHFQNCKELKILEALVEQDRAFLDGHPTKRPKVAV
jgi:hypothetical protein